ncbi:MULTISPECIES: primosomal protein N' [unclassified Fusibacter]|uniref:replication restart helicase PriA n=1 Tax=unclassified Fusibacter TaxID=2624464 RepID=UPI0013E91985|nr:primosomal protein N' [Fusibacter sp. A1]MCK8058050.1 primosomal protein N' [Fusibacter sp. A2]NPE20632.1 primosomal protein N' [Fusibacter sp. A1]
MFAEIIINYRTRELDQLFTYEVPDKFSHALKSGDRVVVPFGNGNRVSDGVVWRTFDENPQVPTKLILEVLPSAYRLTRSQLLLMHTLRNRYAATYQEAYQTVLPAGQKLVRIEHYKTLQSVQSLEMDKVYSKEEMLEFFSAGKIKKLVDEGALHPIVNFEFKTSPRVIEWISTSFDSLEEAIALCGKNAIKRHRILTHMDEVEEQPLLSVTKATQSTRKDIQFLIDKKLLTYEVRSDEVDVFKHGLEEDKQALPPLTEDQKTAVALFEKYESGKRHALLEGVTGSGKTRVYIELAIKALEKGDQVLVLVPEISLTPQLITRFKRHVTQKIAVLHTRVSASDKARLYEQIITGEVDVVIGARSALFAPYKNLGLVIVDEEHESSFKSDTLPRYNALELVKVLAGKLPCDLLLGSATPSLISRHMVDLGKMQSLVLKNRIGSAGMAAIDLVDMRHVTMKNRLISTPLYDAIRESFSKNQQVILFHNRKGYANYSQCERCGEVEKCMNCDIPMTIYSRGDKMVCHYCGYEKKVNMECSSCGEKLIHKGTGVEQLTDLMNDLFPNKRFERLDSDISRSGTQLIDILGEFNSGSIDCLIGTQILAKGLDFPNVTLVGVISADQSINMPDYQATERSFQLLTQVAGRAGRHGKTGRVIIQTFQPDHDLFKYLLKHDTAGFASEEKRMRDLLGYPPYGMLNVIRVSAENQNVCQRQSQKIYEFYQQVFKKHGIDATVYPPNRPHYAKIKNKYRYQLVIKSTPQGYAQMVRMLYNGIIKNKYQLIDPACFVDLDFDPTMMA